jgi:hypothetical protein
MNNQVLTRLKGGTAIALCGCATSAAPVMSTCPPVTHCSKTEDSELADALAREPAGSPPLWRLHDDWGCHAQ